MVLYKRQRIPKTCGQEAAGLVPVLVKPMVRRSNLCDLSHDDARDLVRHFIFHQHEINI
jgi:hypothetical protein